MSKLGNWFNNIFGKKTNGKSEKEIATDRGEPYIKVLNIDVDPKIPRNGAFELDWNNAFIINLHNAGYPANESDIKIIDMWFQDVCRQVAMQTYELAAENNELNYDIGVEDLGEGKKSYS